MQEERGIVKDGLGQDQPRTKKDAQELGVRKPRVGEVQQSQQPGEYQQEEAAKEQSEGPGQPAKGE